MSRWFLLLLSAGAAAAQNQPTVSRITNAFSFGPAVSPGALASLFGENFGTDKSALTVTIGGKPAFLLLVTNTQVNLQIPVDLTPGQTSLTATRSGAASSALTFTLSAYAPAILSQGSSANVFLDNKPASQVKRGDTVYVFATGLGASSPPLATGVAATTLANCATAPQLTLGGVSIAPSFCGVPPGFLGTFQLNFKIPDTVPFGIQPFVLTIAGASSPTVNITIASPGPAITSLLNGGSQSKSAAIAPGEIITITGTGFGTKDQLTIFPSTAAQGVSVTIGGMPAPVLNLIVSASPSQITVMVPFELSPQDSAPVIVKTADASSAPLNVSIVAASPGILRSGYKNYGAISAANPSFGDPSPVPGLGFSVNCGGYGALALSTCGRPIKPGDVIQIFATGLGSVADANGNPLPTGQIAPIDGSAVFSAAASPSVTIGGAPANVSFSGIVPGTASIYQITATIPPGVAPGDDVPLQLSIGSTTDTVSIAISQP